MEHRRERDGIFFRGIKERIIIRIKAYIPETWKDGENCLRAFFRIAIDTLLLFESSITHVPPLATGMRVMQPKSLRRHFSPHGPF